MPLPSRKASQMYTQRSTQGLSVLEDSPQMQLFGRDKISFNGYPVLLGVWTTGNLNLPSGFIYKEKHKTREPFKAPRKVPLGKRSAGNQKFKVCFPRDFSR